MYYLKKIVIKMVLGAFALMGICSNASAQTFNAGTGVPNDPYIITTAEHLNNMKNNLRACFKLGSDINLTEWINTNSPILGWEPIGSEATPFSGNLDGAGHFITGIWCERSGNNIGLFGVICGAVTIKKLGVIVNEEKKIKGSENIGIIAGFLTNSGKEVLDINFDQIFVNGDIEATNKSIGGIVGNNNSMNIIMTNCYAAGSVTSAGNATGGLLGNSWGPVRILIDKCYALNRIKCNDGAVGGILGAVSATSTDNLNLTISNSAAINKSITASADVVSRLCGWIKDEKITLIDNIAFGGLKINDKIVSSNSGSHRHGLDKSEEELAEQSTYVNWDFTSVWKMGNGSFQLPVLKSLDLLKQPSEAFVLDSSTGNPFEYLVQKNGSLNVITACGAVGDGRADDTNIIQLAIDACSPKHATVILPRGRYKVRPLFLKSNVTLEIQEGATIQGSTRKKDYDDAFPSAGAIETSALIYGKDIMNVKITGKGKIDGKGGSSEFMLGNSAPGRPKLVHFIRCQDVTIENVELTNSAFWTVHLLLCDRVKIAGVKLYSHTNWNNDGLDIDSKNVEIENCIIDCDDDGICMKSDRGISCENVTVKNCTIRTNCSAIKFGTAGKSGFKNISYSNCTILRASEDNFRKHHLNNRLSWMGITSNPSTIAGIALESVDGGDLDGITISDITMTDVQTAIFIRLGDRIQNNSGISKLRNVTISNIKATTVSKLASSIVGVPNGIIENVLIKDIEITVPGGGTANDANAKVPECAKDYPEANMFGMILPAHGFYVRHAKDVKFENVKLKLEKFDARPPFVFDDVEGHEIVAISNTSLGNTINIIQRNDKLLVAPTLLGNVEVELMDMTGALLYSTRQMIADENETISIDAPSCGIYLISVRTANDCSTKKIVVK